MKIVASDSPSNAAGAALVGELESSAFQIDNTPPTIAVGTVRVDRGRTIIPFDVKDDNSPIQRVEVSQDGQRWRSVFPVDGIADSRSEHYEVTLDGELGERGLTVRASDSMNNVVTVHVDRAAPAVTDGARSRSPSPCASSWMRRRGVRWRRNGRRWSRS